MADPFFQFISVCNFFYLIRPRLDYSFSYLNTLFETQARQVLA